MPLQAISLLELESRNNLTPFIPGWNGSEQVVYGNFDSDGFPDRAVVAQQGGSVRLMVFHNPHTGGVFDAKAVWPTMNDAILFDPNFRGGGRLAVVRSSLTADHSVPDTLLVTPEMGGGPVVAKFDFLAGNHFEFLAPLPVNSRTGVLASEGDVDGDGRPEALLIAGGELVAVDMRTFETKFSIHVGDDAEFEPTGGTIEANGHNNIVIQHGPTTGDWAVGTQMIPVG